MMRRVSKLKRTKTESFNQNFSPFYELNNRLKMEEWQKMVPSDECITVYELLDKIKHQYHIPPHVAKDLVLIYKSYSISPRAKKLLSHKCQID